jgi:hypothetical protein
MVEVIARVRVAPVERWCGALLVDLQHYPNLAKLPGMTIFIDPRSMQVNRQAHKEDTKWWAVLPESRKVIVEMADFPSQGVYICEHMLEMD